MTTKQLTEPQDALAGSGPAIAVTKANTPRDLPKRGETFIAIALLFLVVGRKNTHSGTHRRPRDYDCLNDCVLEKEGRRTAGETIRREESETGVGGGRLRQADQLKY